MNDTRINAEFKQACLMIRQDQNQALIEQLHSSPALVTAANAAGETLLHQAAAAGNIKAIEHLLERGADPTVSAWKMGPLDFALWNARAEASRLLIDHGAHCSEETLHILLRKAVPELFASVPVTQLVGLMSHEPAPELAQLLGAWFADDAAALEQCESLDMLSHLHFIHDTSPLHYAAMQGNLALCETMLRTGFDIKARDDHGLTPLDYAFLFNRRDLMACLHTHGAQFDNLPNLSAVWNFSREHAQKDDVSDGAERGTMEVVHNPDPCDQFESMVNNIPPAEYTWFYRSTVSNPLSVPLTVCWFDHFVLWEGQWYPGNVKDRPLMAADFSMWYGDEGQATHWDGVIPPGASARCEVNWHCSDSNTAIPRKWAYRAVDPDGRAYYAEAQIESVPQ